MISYPYRTSAKGPEILGPDLVEAFFCKLASMYGRRGGDHHSRPSKMFRGLRWGRAQVGIDGQAEDRTAFAPWRRSVAERLLTGYVRRRVEGVPGAYPDFPRGVVNRPVLDVFRDWFEDRTGYREVRDVETMLEAVEGLGGHEFDVCVEIAKGFGWKVATPEPDDRPLPWDWTCGRCGGHRMGKMLAGDLGVCSSCGTAWPIKKAL